MLAARRVLASKPASAAGQKLYFTDSTNSWIRRVNLDGTGLTNIVTGAGAPHGVALDATFIYYAGTTLTSVGRANRDGTGANNTWAAFAGGVAGADLDIHAGVLYVAMYNAAKVTSIVTSTAAITDPFITTNYSPPGVCTDGNHVYWSDAPAGSGGQPPAIIRDSAMNGTGITQIVSGATNALGMFTDGVHIYWADQGNIGRANMDGSGAVTNFITGCLQAQDVTSDGVFLYWTNFNGGTGRIGRANLDGTGVNQSWLSPGSTVIGITVG